MDRETGEVYIGGDSSAVAEYDMLTIATPKVFHVGEMLFGFAGHFRFGQIVQHAFVPPKYKGGDITAYMSRDMMEALREAAHDSGFLKNIDGRDRAGLGIVGFRGRLFILQDEFEVLEPTDSIASIGCGYPYAIGAMRALTQAQPDLSVEQRMQIALETSEYYSGGVRGPFRILKLEGEHGRQQDNAGDSRRNSKRKRKSSRRPAEED